MTKYNNQKAKGVKLGGVQKQAQKQRRLSGSQLRIELLVNMEHFIDFYMSGLLSSNPPGIEMSFMKCRIAT